MWSCSLFGFVFIRSLYWSLFICFYPTWSSRGFISVCLRHLLGQGKMFISNLVETELEVCFRVLSWASAYGHENLANSSAGCISVLSGLRLLWSTGQWQWPSLEPEAQQLYSQIGTSIMPHWHVSPPFSTQKSIFSWLCAMLCRYNSLLGVLWI